MTSAPPLVDWLRDALGGPGHLRFVIQPIVAILLGLRDGRLDALAGRAPYLWGLLVEKGRPARLRDALRAAAIPLAVAVVVDALLQLYALRTIRPRVALAVGILVVGVPYLVFRALGNRAYRALRGGSTPAGPTVEAP